MTESRIFILLLMLFVLSLSVVAQSLPTAVKTTLDKSYKGWKLTSKTAGCSAEFSKSVVSGDLENSALQPAVFEVNFQPL